ncbi:contact-dependent growth inhibition system immunity protein [Snodgrassella alvi]|uniref:contact-dependent growth inhibition system immunity protein n=1 Tax=Snodgrassella alvi TaxID=1196083 RepID=UPI00351A9600
MFKFFKALASKHKEPKRKGCNLYVLPDNSVIIQGFSYEYYSPGFVHSHVRARISEELIPVLLGSLVLTITNTTNVVNLKEWAKDHDSYSKAFLSLAGYKNFRRLEKETACVFIELENNVITITPTEYDRKDGGFSGVVNKEVTCSPDAESIYEHLIPLLKRSNYEHLAS